MANHMAEVAKMLGVELDEWFEIDGIDGDYMFDKDGLYCYKCRLLKCDDKLLALLAGDLIIKCKPWKPKYAEKYWYISNIGSICMCTCVDCTFDVINYKIGNCYRIREEAEANRDKWVEFYASNEVLEV